MSAKTTNLLTLTIFMASLSFLMSGCAGSSLDVGKVSPQEQGDQVDDEDGGSDGTLTDGFFDPANDGGDDSSGSGSGDGSSGGDSGSSSGDDGSSSGSDSGSGSGSGSGDDSSADCDDGSRQVELFDIDPDSVAGANIVFLVDDSGSMDAESAEVASLMQDFLDGVSAGADDYRVALIFDKDGAAFDGNNPFSSYIYHPTTNPDSTVYYFESRTWSKWADIAFFRTFGQVDYVQTLPSPIPLDNPPAGYVSMLPSECQDAGDYFRPRQNTSNFNNTPGCISALEGASLNVDIANYLLADTAVNIISISDDDINVNYNGDYPAITDLMIKDVISKLGSNMSYRYHSIVGTMSNDAWEAQSGPGFDRIDRIGQTHMDLSTETSGLIADIREEDYSAIFDDLTEEIFFSEQSVNLSCRPSNVSVRLGGIALESADFTLDEDIKRITFRPSAFEKLDPEDLSGNVRARVAYDVDLN